LGPTSVFDEVSLNSVANSLLNDSRLAVLPTACQSSLKKMVCSNIYLKCPQNINLTSPSFSGWNIMIYTDILKELAPFVSKNILKSPYIPLPFERPCRKVCDDVTNNCLGLLGLFGFGQDCSARYDYSHGSLSLLYTLNASLHKPFQYDSSNNAQVCNYMNTTVPVAASKEPYLKATDPTGACYGITDYLFVPPGNKVSASLGPMQPPFVVQGIIENQLSASISALPKWLSQQCHFALRKYFCGSFMLSPYTESMLAILNSNGLTTAKLQFLVGIGALPAAVLTYSFVLPSYPHYSVCTEYASACGEFIALAGLAALVPTCDAVIGGVSSYPTTYQTILSVPFALGGQSVAINVKTPPNSMLAATDGGYVTNCPEGYVVPDGEDKRTKWIPGSGCAVSCFLPSNTVDEWKQLYVIASDSAWIGLPVILFLILSWTVDSKKRKQYLVILFGCYSLIATLTFCISTSLPAKRSYCKTNAVGYDHTDKRISNFCGAQALLLGFAGVGTALSWAMLAVDLFLKVVIGYRSTQQFRFYLLGTPIAITGGLLILGSQNRFGATGQVPLCFIVLDGNLGVVHVPMLVGAVVGFVCMSAVVVTIARSIIRTHNQSAIAVSAEGSSNPATANSAAVAVLKKFHMLRIPIAFIIVYIFILVAYESFRWTLYRYKYSFISAAMDFTECVFKSYDGTNSWKKVCGKHPGKRVASYYEGFVVFCVAGQSILLGSIYLLNPSVWTFWKNALGIRLPTDLLSKYGLASRRGSSNFSEGGSVIGGSSKRRLSRKSVARSSVNAGGEVPRSSKAISVNKLYNSGSVVFNE